MKWIKIFLLNFCLVFLNLSCDSINQTNTDGNNTITKTNSNTANENTETLDSSLKFNESGYDLPDLTRYELSSENVKLDIDSPKPVYVNTYFPRAEQLLQTPSLGKMRVRNVREYKIEKRVFCYVILVTQPPPKVSNTSNVGISINLVYYDLDGDEKFEIQDRRFADYPTMFPRWLNKN